MWKKLIWDRRLDLSTVGIKYLAFFKPVRYLPKCLLSALWTSKRLLFLADIKRNSIIYIE